MCCEDQKIQSGVWSGAAIVGIGVASVEVFAQNDKRRTLILASAITETTTYTPEMPAVAGLGIIMTGSARPVVLTFREHGRIVCSSWHAIHPSGPINVLAIEGVEVDGPC